MGDGDGHAGAGGAVEGKQSTAIAEEQPGASHSRVSGGSMLCSAAGRWRRRWWLAVGGDSDGCK